MARATIRAFVSYSTKDKHEAAEVKAALRELGVECFLAHDDIRVSEEWKDRVIEELADCDVFIPLLSKNFRSSDWTAQEIGFAFAKKDIFIIPLSLDPTIPFGFISHIQGTKVGLGSIKADLFQDPLLGRFPRVLLRTMIERVENAWSYRNAEAVVRPLVPLFRLFTKDEANAFALAAANNNQVWSAGRCRAEYLPEFIRRHRKRLEPALLKRLEYQVEHDEAYSGP